MRDRDKKKKTSIALKPATLVKLKRRAKLESRSFSSFLDFCFNRILEELEQERRNRATRRILKGILVAGGAGLIAFSPAQMPRERCKHFCLPHENPMWEVMPHS